MEGSRRKEEGQPAFPHRFPWALAFIVSTFAGPVSGEESGQVMALGGAGVAITGRNDAYLSNPAHLAGMDRWSMATGFVAGSMADARPGITKDNRPSSFWSTLSEAALLAPLPGGWGLAGFSSHIQGARIFRASYDRIPAFSDFQDIGFMIDAKSNVWFRGIAGARKLGLDTSVGLALGLVQIKQSSYRAYEEYAPHKYGQGFTTEISQTVDEVAKGNAFGLVLGGKYRLRKNLHLGGTFSYVTPAKLKDSYASYLYRKTEPSLGLYPDLNQALEGNLTLTSKPPMTLVLGGESKPVDKLRFLIQGKVSLPSQDGRVTWVERLESGVPTLHGIPWTSEKKLTVQGSLGAEFLAGRWGFRLGFRSLPSASEPINDELEEQEERVEMRAATLGLGFKNPFLIFDLGYAYGWGRGDAKSATYSAYPAPQDQVESVTLVPIYRREAHSILMTFSYIF